MAKPYVGEIKEAAKENAFFRKVLFTGDKSQLVLMSLQPGEDIGMEMHDVDQMFYAVKGAGTIILDGADQTFKKGMVVCVPAGTRHNVIAAAEEPLKLFTLYSPPQHAVGTVHRTKREALAAEKEHAAA